MKTKNISQVLILVLSISFFSFIPERFSKEGLARFQTKLIDEEDLYYKLKFVEIFEQTSEAGFTEKLHEVMPEIVIVKIYYDSSTMIIKAKKQTVFDDIKKNFYAYGHLKIVKHESFKKFID